MKKGFIILVSLLFCLFSNAQEKKNDTIVKTEIVNVVTKYNPKIADAKKINKNPIINLLKRNERKKLKYVSFSAPVLSTFTPKAGAIKPIDVGVRERIYNNYLVAGYGNYGNSYVETYLYKKTRSHDKFGFFLKYDSSQENIKNTLLNSTFLNFNTDVFFKKETKYFDWKINLNSQINNYNWYGLPNINFNETAINSINEAQSYTFFELAGDLKFHDSYIDYSKISIAYFTDKFKSKEILFDFQTTLKLSLGFNKDNNISLKTGVEYLTGDFKTKYENTEAINYNLITINLNPEYKIKVFNFSINAGLKSFISIDSENKKTNLLLFPNMHIQKSIIKKFVYIYGGFTGNLHTNTYKNFTEENPYISPTLFITQTAETSNLFIGFNGNISNQISYNIKATSKKEEDKPLFLRNNSKSDGNSTNVNGKILKGYEYGNSFKVYYDDVKTTSILAEASYLFSKNTMFNTQIKYHNYTTTNILESYNLPTLEAFFSWKYKNEKWYTNTNIYYVGERKDVLYNATFPSNFDSTKILNSFVDINIDGGYNFSGAFSVFLKLNNILNTKYQRFSNFDVQGFQILGGAIYKFDF